jgi:protein TonB
VPFVRPRSETPPPDSAPSIQIAAADRPAPQLIATESQARILGLVALSLMAHAGFYLLTNREPPPMASIGLEAISVELVLGANSPAGAAPTPSPQETQTAPTEQPQAEPDKPEVQEQKPPDQTAAAPPEVKPETPPPPEQQPPEPPAVQPQAQTPPEPAPVAQEPVKSEPVTPEPPKVELKPAPTHPAPPKPAPRREVRPKPAPKREAAREAPRAKAAKQADAPGPRANAANGVGAGRSQNSANYRGMVSAHLARYKRFPPEAQSQGAQGAASVRFALNGSGGVTSVSLVHGTGVSALDQEAVAMVRRASPFPAPPDGRPVSFTVPVSYKMR